MRDRTWRWIGPLSRSMSTGLHPGFIFSGGGSSVPVRLRATDIHIRNLSWKRTRDKSPDLSHSRLVLLQACVRITTLTCTSWTPQSLKSPLCPSTFSSIKEHYVMRDNYKKNFIILHIYIYYLINLNFNENKLYIYIFAVINIRSACVKDSVMCGRDSMLLFQPYEYLFQ